MLKYIQFRYHSHKTFYFFQISMLRKNWFVKTVVLSYEYPKPLKISHFLFLNQNENFEMIKFNTFPFPTYKKQFVKDLFQYKLINTKSSCQFEIERYLVARETSFSGLMFWINQMRDQAIVMNRDSNIFAQAIVHLKEKKKIEKNLKRSQNVSRTHFSSYP